MDPVSGIWAALSIIQVIETAVRLARSIQRAETKGVDLMVYRLVLEKKRFTHWANRMRTLEADTVRKIITREDEMIVMKVKASLEEHIRSAEERLARFKIAKEKTVGGLLVRARIAYRGYEDVKELLDAMKTMNEVLYSIAPPAPPSYHQADFLRPGEAFADRHGSSLQELPSERDLRRPSPSSLLRERRNDGIAETDQSVPNDQPEVDGDAALRDLEVEELRLPLRTLFKSTLKPLDLIVSLQSDPRISKIRQRLNVWGSGLFEGSYDLDSILDAGREPQKALLDVLREALIKILVLEEQELANYNMTSGAIDEMKRKDLQQASSDLTILLGGEDIGLSLYYKSAIVDSLEHHHSNLWDILSAGQTVEDLFELLPAISTIQQGVCLQSERLQEKKGIEQEPSPESLRIRITDPPLPAEQHLLTISRVVKHWDHEKKRLTGETGEYETTLNNIIGHLGKWAGGVEEARKIQMNTGLKQGINKFLGSVQAEEGSYDSQKSSEKQKEISIPFNKHNEQELQDLIHQLRNLLAQD